MSSVDSTLGFAVTKGPTMMGAVMLMSTLVEKVTRSEGR
jgi:hypothetical protein